jgi:hemoglobin
MTHGATFIDSALVDQLDEDAAAFDPASAFARVGGAKAVVAVVEEFYARLLRDPRTAPAFAGLAADEGMAGLKRHQVLMLTQALGGPARYAGRDLGEAHADLAITEDTYRRVCLYLLTTLHDFRVPMEVLTGVDALLRGLAGQIVSGASGEDLPR